MTLHRHAANPILTREDLPDIPPHITDPTSVFNPGAVHHQGDVVLLLRVQTRGRRTFLVLARSWNGFAFEIADEVVEIEGIDRIGEEVYHVYDPRITRIDDEYFVTLAVDTDQACRLATVHSTDLTGFRFLGADLTVDARNGVLFPEMFGDRFLRLERPNVAERRGEPPSGDEIRLSESTDLVHWQPVATVLRGRPRSWDERIGSGPPPVKTREGWLHIYHGVATHFGSVNVYQAGAVLLDLEDPSKVLARTRENILEPREPWELVGQVPNVVFPSGMVAEKIDDDGFAEPGSRVLVYYGAADTVVGLATATVAELIDDCR